MRDDRERLQDILDAIGQIEKYVDRGPSNFQENELIQVWIVHHLQIIGEACSATSEQFQQQHPEIEWANIIAFRNIIVHEYFRVNLEIVWQIANRELAELKVQIETILFPT